MIGKKKRRHALTLIEIMIVIVLIGIITSVIGFNLKGTLKKGKDFKTEKVKEKIKNALSIEAEMEGITLDKSIERDAAINLLVRSGFFGTTKEECEKNCQDGWGNSPYFDFSNQDIKISFSPPPPPSVENN